MIQAEPVVTRYSADAGQLLSALEQIKASQAQLSSVVDKQSASLTAQNKKLNESVAFWGKVNVGIAALPGIIGKVTSAFDEMASLLQMKSAAAGVNIEALDDALKGQLKTTELYTLAAAINSSAIKLNGAEQKVLAGALRQLGLEGKNTTEAAKDFAKVLATGETNELKKYGISVVGLNGKAKDFAAVLRDDLTPMADQAGKTMETSAEQMKQASNDISDGLTKAKMALAEFGAEVTAQMSGRKAMDKWSLSSWLIGLSGQAGMANVALKVRTEAANTAAAIAEANEGKDWAAGLLTKSAQARRDELDAIGRDIIIHDDKAGGGGRRMSEAEARAKRMAALLATVNPAVLENFAAVTTGSARTFDAPGMNMSIQDTDRVNAALAASIAAIPGLEYDRRMERKQTFLEQNFGTIESINGYALAFDALGSAGSAAMSAWIDGSMSAGAAIKAAIAESVKALAIDMTMKALQHGAYAIGSLAFGDARGAALHAKSAAMFAAGAVIAGGAAKGLGSGASGGGGAAPTITGGGASSGGGDTSSVITIGDAFADDSPRARARKARRLVQLARRSQGKN